MIDRDDRTVLSAYLDGELTAEERAEVEAELAVSPEWREELDAVRAARDAVRRLSARDPRAGFWDDVMAAVRAAPEGDAVDAGTDPALAPEVEPSPVVPLAPRRRTKVVPWVAAGAAVAAAVVAVFVIPGREPVRPNVTAVATQHGAATAQVGDPISGLVPLGPLRGPR